MLKRWAFCVVAVMGLLPCATVPALAQTQQAYAVRECVSGCTGWDLLRYDAVTGARLTDIHLSSHPTQGEITLSGPGQLALSAEGRRGYIAFNQRITVVDLTTNQVLATFATVFAPSSPVVAPGGQRLYVLNHTSLDTDQLIVLNSTSGAREATIELPGVSNPDDLVVLADESAAFFTTPSGLVRVTRPTGTVDTLPMASLVDAVAAPDGSRVYVVDTGGVVTAIDPVTLSAVDSVTVTSQFGGFGSLAIAPDGTELYVGLGGNTLFSGSAVRVTTSPLAQGSTLTGGATVSADPAGAQILAIGNSTGTSSSALLRLVAVAGGNTTSLGSFDTSAERLWGVAMGPRMSGCSVGPASPTSVAVSHVGGSGSISVTADLGCAWLSRAEDESWLTIDTGGAGTGSIRYSAGINPAMSARQTVVRIGDNLSVLVSQDANPNSLTAMPSTLHMAAYRPLPTLIETVTAAQRVTLGYTGATVPQWTATSDQSWVTVSPASGTGAAQLSVAISQSSALLPAGNATATITISAPNASLLTTVTVSLANYSTLAAPIGLVDTPIQGASGLQGAIAFTGWAVHSIGIDRVEVYRNCLPFDLVGTCTTLGGRSVVFVGNGSRVPGARPDVAAAFSTYPDIDKAGWGINILSNMLPNVTAGQSTGGVGTLELMAFAVTGGTFSTTKTLLGRSRFDMEPTTVTLANDTIAKPFGAIDTPGQGATVSGSINNFGWALTPDPGTGVLVPVDGSTVTVFVDGAPVGAATYNLCRGSVAVNGVVPSGQLCDDDVSSVFRGDGSVFRNLDAGRGPIGLRAIDTTSLSNGQHTLSWSVTDSANRAEGIGSRYINVVNGSTDPYVARRALTRREQDVARRAFTRRETGGRQDNGGAEAPPYRSPLLYARTGFDLSTGYAPLAVNAAGVAHVRIPELGRVELQLPGVESGELIVNGEARALPIGVGIDRERGIVTWAPGAGFLGTYRLAFSGANPGTTEPRDSGTLGLQDPGTSGPRDFVFDVSVVPAQYAEEPVRMHVDRVSVEGPAMSERTVRVEGWALDPQAWTGSGVGAVHVWARRRGAVQGSGFSVQGAGEASPIFLGTATLGLSRPDVAAAHGAEYGDAGFAFTGVLPDAGEWEVTAYVWISRTGRFEDARSVQVVVR
jgi:hypothetical protein